MRGWWRVRRRIAEAICGWRLARNLATLARARSSCICGMWIGEVRREVEGPAERQGTNNRDDVAASDVISINGRKGALTRFKKHDFRLIACCFFKISGQHPRTQWRNPVRLGADPHRTRYREATQWVAALQTGKT